MKMPSVTTYRLTDAEVIASALPCVVIDETGTPGQDIGSVYLHPTRKTWVAVILTSREFATASSELPPALKELKELCGGEEFHMTDLYRGHKSFKDVSREQRLSIIAFLSHIFSRYQYPILVQTLDDVEIKKFSHPNFQRKIGVLDLRKSGELALWILLHRIQDILGDPCRAIKSPAYVVIDQNQWKNDKSINISGTVSNPTVFVEGKIYSQNSQQFPCLQLADFAAFCINRQQWLMASDKKNEFDLAFLRIISEANFNCINLQKWTVDLDLWLASDYDFHRGLADETRGIPSR
jgi:hypothetical protein